MSVGKVVFIGCGNMGEAMLRRMLEAEAIQASEVTIAEHSAERSSYLAATYSVQTDESFEPVKTADVIVLGVKPQQMADMPVFETKSDAIVISMLAGTTIAAIKTHFQTAIIARTMPNLAFASGNAVVGLCYEPSHEWTSAQQGTVRQLLEPGGLIVTVTDEAKMNEITAVTGSGPAYFYWFGEQVARAAQGLGFSETEADNMARQVFIGAAKILEANPDESLSDFRSRVTSKGGTTEAALNVFSNSDVPVVTQKALQAARDRSQELSA